MRDEVHAVIRHIGADMTAGVPRQRPGERVALLPVHEPHAADMRGEITLAHELRDHRLVQARRLAVDQVARRDISLQQRLGHHGVADAQTREQRLVEGADIDHALVLVQALQRGERPAGVAELAGVVVLDDEGPALRAHAMSANRRAIDKTTPVGNWCEGVTNAARARGAVAMPTSTRRPSASTGTGCNTAFASMSWRRVRK